ncbi:M24 family metallopeptidase [Veillonella agrestimuris]|uniref:M24 family metallopeptidase n=1 Tax=Veillonella agrestimuris TaxID=2941340 RepID=UPI00203B026E|nr:Xaa-Pro peptidase family protein [Veillonella agrestimuris]
MNGLHRLQQYIKDQQLTGVIIISPTNLHYFAGFTGTEAFAFITDNKAYIVTDFRYTEQAMNQCEGYTVIQYSTTVMDAFVDILNEHHIHEGLFGVEGKYMPVDTYELLCDTLDERFNFTSINLATLRAVKRDDELIYMREAARIGDEAFAALLPQLKVGMTENDARIILESEMLKRGSEEPSFATIVASGHRSSMPHGVASDKIIEEGDFVTFDFGAVYKGYHSDMTRTIVMGKANEEQKELYAIVLEAQQRGVNAVKAGISGKELDEVSRSYIREKGYGSAFHHGLGHGVGLDIHEQPTASPKSDSTLEHNMIITIEPGIYLSGKIGLRIEDSVIVKTDGYELLTHSPKELIEIGV